MIETLGSKAASPAQEDPGTPALVITRITFQDGDLSRPRYGSLIHQDHAPAGVQFEPCLQIRETLDEPLTVRFEIDPGVRFVATGLGTVLVTSILDPQNPTPPGLVSATFVSGDLRKCDLVWDQAEADAEGFGQLNTLRLHCEFEDSNHSPLTPVEQVEGGLYLAILNREESLFEMQGSNPPGEPVPETIKMLGFDSIGRPRYDLFLPHDSLPEALVLEPAFRCREGQIVSFSLALDLPPQIELRFVTDVPPNADQVAVSGFLPSGHPFQLYQTTVGEFGGKEKRKSTVTWTQETGRQYCQTSNVREAKRCYCILGQTSSFGLRAAPHGQLVPELRKMASIDPTVIQPPNCTSSGICITP
jgi:hypothetical protein